MAIYPQDQTRAWCTVDQPSSIPNKKGIQWTLCTKESSAETSNGRHEGVTYLVEKTGVGTVDRLANEAQRTQKCDGDQDETNTTHHVVPLIIYELQPFSHCSTWETFSSEEERAKEDGEYIL